MSLFVLRFILIVPLCFYFTEGLSNSVAYVEFTPVIQHGD